MSFRRSSLRRARLVQNFQCALKNTSYEAKSCVDTRGDGISRGTHPGDSETYHQQDCGKFVCRVWFEGCNNDTTGLKERGQVRCWSTSVKNL